MATLLVLGLTFVQAFHEPAKALQGNCRLFGCNTVVKFDLHSETCCGATVYLKDLDENGNENTKCCYGRNSTMYDVETQECCGGEVIWKDSSSRGCCQGKIFNTDNGTCCEGEIKDINSSPCCGNDATNPNSPVQCCGGQMYDNNKETCCNGNVRNNIGECCGTDLWNPADDKCCRHNGEASLHISGFGTNCCGLDTYLPGEQLCCKSVVNNKIDNTIECCGNTTINITTEVCCQGHVLPRESGKNSCCGGQLFDEDDEVCCRGKVRPGGGRAKCCNEQSYQEEKEVCFNGLVLNKSVAQIDGVVRLVENSTTAYLSANQFECDGELITRSRKKNACCDNSLGINSTMYDVETQECCGGEVIWKDSSLKGCCQGNIYNKNVYTCCEGELRNKHTSPCCGNDPVNLRSPVQCCGGEMYDNSRQTCCNGIIHDDMGECCGSILWDPADDNCCRHNGAASIHIGGFGTNCCGLDTYLPGEQLCCESVVNNKIDNTIECCGNTTFNITTEVCCQGHVLPRASGKESCCGGQLFDGDDEVCCRGKVRPGGGRAKCCNEQSYQEEKEVCFNGLVLNKSVPQIDGVVRLVENSTTAYLSANQFECDGELITRSRKKNACCDNTAYNSADHICCEVPDSSFEIVQKSSSQDRCCGRSSYNPDSQGCCNSNNVFDLENEICNENGVHPRYGSIEAAKSCLRNKLNKDKVCKIGGTNAIPYNSDTSVCTPRGVVALPEGRDICANKTFKKDLFICCRGKIFMKEVDNETQECCPNAIDKETFIPTIQTCYNGRIAQTPEIYASFCKGNVYDNSTYECDVTGKIRSKEEIKEEPHVCWYSGTHYSYFNNETEKCCNGHIIDAVFTCCAEESECCNAGDTQGYNRETHVCCGGVLREVPMKKPSNDCRGNQCPEPQDNSFLCCQGTPYEGVDGELTCDGNLLTGRLQNGGIICRGTLHNHGTDCCGGISYDNAIEICCGGVVANRTDSTSCCGNHFYNPMNSDSLCCESSFYENASGHGCCGGVKYNLKNETCCTTGGKTYVFSSNGGLCCSNGEDYDDTLHTCCDGLVHKYITNGTCCGNDVIRDPTREGCYNDRIYQLQE